MVAILHWKATRSTSSANNNEEEGALGGIRLNFYTLYHAVAFERSGWSPSVIWEFGRPGARVPVVRTYC